MNQAIFGFSLLRNGIKYDYSFRESLNSLSDLCESVYLALGTSDDGTEGALDLPNLKIIPTIWNDRLREGGLILSQQTNIALKALREDKAEIEGAWGIYLQCDEVLHEDDFQLIKADIAKAEAEGYDAMSFRYLHFWEDHQHIAINKKWYPHEIRAIKLDSAGVSWGDAQSFKNVERVYASEARVFHYGHVRENTAYRNKKADILKLYHTDNTIGKYKRRERRYDAMTECLTYYGPHPKYMKERIDRMGDTWRLDPVPEVYLVDHTKEFLDQVDPGFFSQILTKKVYKCTSLEKVPKDKRDKAIILNVPWWKKAFHPETVPPRMKSKLAWDWTPEFYLTLKLSEKKVGISSRKL